MVCDLWKWRKREGLKIDFANQVVVITGAGGGLGRSYALLLAKLGAAVVVNDLGGSVHGEDADSSAADAVVEEIREAGGNAIADYSTVASPEGGAAIVEAGIEEFGQVDVLINNAGILRDKSFLKLEPDNIQAVLGVHLYGAFYVTRSAFAHMKEKRYGRVVLTSSASGLFGNFGQSNYAAAKMGLVGLMNVLKLEGAKHDILINTVAPIAGTRMTEDYLGEAAQKFDAASVAPAVAYLASSSCGHTGEIWSVGGGSVRRVFVGLSGGYFKHPGEEGPLTVEDVVANLDVIRREDDYSVPFSLQDELTGLIPRLLSE